MSIPVVDLEEAIKDVNNFNKLTKQIAETHGLRDIIESSILDKYELWMIQKSVDEFLKKHDLPYPENCDFHEVVHYVMPEMESVK